MSIPQYRITENSIATSASIHRYVLMSTGTVLGDVIFSKYWITLITYKRHAPRKFSVYHNHGNFFLFFFQFIFISWRLITLQYCSGFCHTLTWISHGFTYIPHPDPPSHLPLYPISLGLPSAPGPSTCLMHPAWASDLFHPR